jgi:alpha-mannosidase
MREWESYWSGEYGWPRYSEYHHALLPHGANITNAERVRAAEGFGQKLITVVSKPQSGSLPQRKAFITVRPESAHLMVLRTKERQGFELRLVEIEGKKGSASVELAVAMAGASETNFLGKKVAEVSSSAGSLNFELQPWKVRTFEVL